MTFLENTYLKATKSLTAPRQKYIKLKKTKKNSNGELCYRRKHSKFLHNWRPSLWMYKAQTPFSIIYYPTTTTPHGWRFSQ